MFTLSFRDSSVFPYTSTHRFKKLKFATMLQCSKEQYIVKFDLIRIQRKKTSLFCSKISYFNSFSSDECINNISKVSPNIINYLNISIRFPKRMRIKLSNLIYSWFFCDDELHSFVILLLYDLCIHPLDISQHTNHYGLKYFFQ